MRTLLVKIKEDDLLLDLDYMTSHEIVAIEECIYELFDTRGSPSQFECYMTSSGIIVICANSGDIVEIPEEWKEKTIEFGWKGARKELKLIGDYIPIEPVQLGARPWGKVSLKFIDYADLDAD